MPRPYSQDLRDRVIAEVESGASARQAARTYHVSPSTAIKWMQRWRRTGSVEAKPMGGYFRSPLDAQAELVLGLLAAQPDLTVAELRSALGERGIQTGHSSLGRFFKRHGISFKKNPARQRAREGRRGHRAHRVEGRPGLA